MSKIFVIPDVHLKPRMFAEADKLLSGASCDAIVMLGDLVDDWNQEKNLDLYHETFDAAIDFVKDHPDAFWCYGNHDLSYLWNALESGYSYYAEELVKERIAELRNALPPENSAYIHRFDRVLFSHAGLTESFVLQHFGSGMSDLDSMIAGINRMGMKEMWQDNSPIWARPQYASMRIYPRDMFQVVGHTPVEGPLHEGNLLTLDTFSTYRNGLPIGDERFVRVDTVKQTWEYADEG